MIGAEDIVWPPRLAFSPPIHYVSCMDARDFARDLLHAGQTIEGA
jgi:hypothetical protein